jgi:glycosyltransferase involved in cell wall biosynthesis
MSDLVVFTTHAIQYQVPLFQYLSQRAGIDLHVAFRRTPAVEQPYWDEEFERYVQWDIPLTEGYKWSVLPPGHTAQCLSSFIRLHRACGQPPIMLTSWSTPLHWAVWTWAVLSRTPVLLGAETNCQSYALRSRPTWRHQWLRFLIQRTDGLLYIGQRNREFYEWMGASPLRLFSYPYSVDNDRFAETQRQCSGEREQRLSALGLDPSLPTLLFCGKLIPRKRPDLLLETIQLSGLARDINVLFVGDGPLKSKLATQATELDLNRVSFMGFLNQSQMPLAYALGDVLCLFSDAETWGLVVNEALACGRPVIVSQSCGCVPDLVDGKGTGWVVPPGDLAAVSRTLKTAVAQSSSWPAMGEQGRFVVANHTFARMAEGVLAALASLGDRSSNKASEK